MNKIIKCKKCHTLWNPETVNSCPKCIEKKEIEKLGMHYNWKNNVKEYCVSCDKKFDDMSEQRYKELGNYCRECTTRSNQIVMIRGKKNQWTDERDKWEKRLLEARENDNKTIIIITRMLIKKAEEFLKKAKTKKEKNMWKARLLKAKKKKEKSVEIITKYTIQQAEEFFEEAQANIAEYVVKYDELIGQCKYYRELDFTGLYSNKQLKEMYEEE